MSLVAVVLAFAAPGHARNCERLFTPAMGRRAALTVYRGVRRVSLRNLRLLGTIERCQRNPRDQASVRAFDRHQATRWKARRSAALNSSMSPALASWYFAAGGPIACGGDSYAMGVASRSFPCGTRLQICFASCVDAVVFDYGPAAWTGRDMDLSQQVAQAIGFAGVGVVRFQVLR